MMILAPFSSMPSSSSSSFGGIIFGLNPPPHAQQASLGVFPSAPSRSPYFIQYSASNEYQSHLFPYSSNQSNGLSEHPGTPSAGGSAGAEDSPPPQVQHASFAARPSILKNWSPYWAGPSKSVLLHHPIPLPLPLGLGPHDDEFLPPVTLELLRTRNRPTTLYGQNLRIDAHTQRSWIPMRHTIRSFFRRNHTSR
ncbi:hypothetical protein ACHAXM_011278 [Skeletonema potamos]